MIVPVVRMKVFYTENTTNNLNELKDELIIFIRNYIKLLKMLNKKKEITMSKLSQHAAVVKFTQEILGARYELGTDVKLVATKEDKKQIATKIAEAMIEGTVELSDNAMAKYGESVESLTNKYVVGMVTNWFNKSLDLNGGTKYETKNPGSRAGSGDALIKEMRLLKKQLQEIGNHEGVAKVEAAINERVAQLKSTNTKTVTINPDNIPEHLRDLI